MGAGLGRFCHGHVWIILRVRLQVERDDGGFDGGSGRDEIPPFPPPPPGPDGKNCVKCSGDPAECCKLFKNAAARGPKGDKGERGMRVSLLFSPYLLRPYPPQKQTKHREMFTIQPNRIFHWNCLPDLSMLTLFFSKSIRSRIYYPR